MTKKQKRTGLTDGEFETLVDEGFKKPLKKVRKQGGLKPWAMPDSLARELQREGHVEGLTKTAARFHGAMGRLFGGRAQSNPTPETIQFLKDFDAGMREFSKARGIELRDDD